MGTTTRRAARARPRRNGDADERTALLARFARQLRRYRTAAGFTQDRLAAKVGRGRLHVVRLEGARREPSMVTLARLARVLEVPIGALLEQRHAAKAMLISDPDQKHGQPVSSAAGRLPRVRLALAGARELRKLLFARGPRPVD